ncbi:hypothetical protein [Pseudonocardia sp. C8]|uniref:hypothetical protein n=1 Tax=Pseudonocardia sp. C8 TaxID=2762759 RepID=UPI00210289A3|nr:hypothetical protein [Pseudonocardia sp. C8]
MSRTAAEAREREHAAVQRAAGDQGAGRDTATGITVVGGAAAVGRVAGAAAAGETDPVSPPEPGGEPAPARAGKRGPGAPGSVADRLARARQVLYRMETRAGAERPRPTARTAAAPAGPGTSPARVAGTADLTDGDAVSLPVAAPLAALLPGGGLRRGSTVAVGAGPGAGSLLFALLAAASAEGSWAGVVGRPGLGATAAAEAGIRLDRLALVPDPGADPVAVTGALLDGLDLVALAGPERAGLRAADRQRLMARARQRGSVLLALGSWPGAELRLSCERPRWEGVGRGTGRLRYRRVAVRVAGRGIAPAGRGIDVLLPGPGGAVAAAPEIRTPAVRPGTGGAAERGRVLGRVAG